MTEPGVVKVKLDLVRSPHIKSPMVLGVDPAPRSASLRWRCYPSYPATTLPQREIAREANLESVSSCHLNNCELRLMNSKDDRIIMDAMLRHLGCGQDLADFPGTASEKLAFIRTASRRGLIAWRKARGRYELTSFGWTELTPRRRFTLASLMISATTGAIIGAVGLAILWLPADAAHPRRSIRAHSNPSSVATVSIENPGANGGAADSIEPAKVTAQPVSDEPNPTAAPIGGKHAAVKKSHRKAAHHRRAQTGSTWAYADPWRAQQFKYSGHGDQSSWFTYR